MSPNKVPTNINYSSYRFESCPDYKKVGKMKNYKHTDEDGNFKSNYPKNTVGYHLDIMEWIYFHPNMTQKEKLEILIPLEEHHMKYLNEMFPGGNFKWEKWSDKIN